MMSVSSYRSRTWQEGKKKGKQVFQLLATIDYMWENKTSLGKQEYMKKIFFNQWITDHDIMSQTIIYDICYILSWIFYHTDFDKSYREKNSHKIYNFKHFIIIWIWNRYNAYIYTWNLPHSQYDVLEAIQHFLANNVTMIIMLI